MLIQLERDTMEKLQKESIKTSDGAAADCEHFAAELYSSPLSPVWAITAFTIQSEAP